MLKSYGRQIIYVLKILVRTQVKTDINDSLHMHGFFMKALGIRYVQVHLF